MNCEQIQEKILQGLKSEHKEHIANCDNCQNFLSTLNKLSSFKMKKPKCPNYISFDSLLKQAKKESSRKIYYIKWGSFLAAAMFVMAIYIPNAYFFTDNFSTATNIALLNKNINNEINDLTENISDVETDFYVSDDLVDNEIESLVSEMDNLYV